MKFNRLSLGRGDYFTIAFIITLWFPSYTEAGIVFGDYRGSDSWVFLDRFCYAPTKGEENGKFGLEIIYPKYASPDVFIYYLHHEELNEFNKWGLIYGSDMTCAERGAIADETYSLKNYEEPTLATYHRAIMDVPVKTTRPRWVFVSVANCEKVCEPPSSMDECMSGLDISYMLNFTNYEDGINQYFSFDQQGIFATCISFLILYIFPLYETIVVRSTLKALRKYHVTVKLLVFSVWCSFFSLLFQSACLGYYSANGILPIKGFEAIAEIFAAIAHFSLLLQVILIAKGWTIVRRKISASGRVKITVFITAYICVYWTAVIYYNKAIDRSTIAYIYDSWAGYILVAMRCFLFLWFCHAVRISIQKYGTKKSFYRKYGIFFGIWLLLLPLYVIINKLTVEYYRAKLLFALEQTATFIVYTALLLMYNPKLWYFNSSFPFHATTTAMLHGKGTVRSRGLLEGSNTFKDAHIRRAAEIARHIQGTVGTIQGFSTDLTEFLDEIDPADDELMESDEFLAVDRSNSSGKLRNVMP